ncbi:MAG: helix-turn-helix domain-containing protein [Desulfovibrio sp.]|nr:helix-turn-helix domain-containing protein [Desulfovibrio sp.]
MTLEEAAQALRITRRTMFTLIKEQGLPARRVGKGWRVDPDALKKWISTRDGPLVDEGEEDSNGE